MQPLTRSAAKAIIQKNTIVPPVSSFFSHSFRHNVDAIDRNSRKRIDRITKTPRSAVFYASSISSSSFSTTSTTTTTTPSSSSSSQSNTKNNDNELTTERIGDRVNLTKIEAGIVKVELSRPEKLNGLDMPMFDAIVECVNKLKKDKSIRVIILCGEGRAFCTGLDVKSVVLKSNPYKNVNRLLEVPPLNDEQDADSTTEYAIANLAQNVAYLWRTLPVPVIAVLHGMCYGGGTQIALGADLRFSTPTCRISLMESKYGLIPDMSASVTLRELIPIDIAKELTMTGRIISGTDAARLNLVTRVVDDDDPMAEALSVAREMKGRSPDSVAACKRLFQRTWVEGSEERCLRLETELQRGLMGGWNQLAASGRSMMGWDVPYAERKDEKR